MTFPLENKLAIFSQASGRITSYNVCYTKLLRPIIHNPQVLEEYARHGVSVAKRAEDIPAGSQVVIRAHGIPRDTESSLEGRGAEIIDATCPRVKKAQILIGRMAREGRIVLLYGESEHPEVKGLVSYASAGAFVFDSLEELFDFPFEAGERYRNNFV